jgi:DNA-binding transcriptional MocR family regulator
LKLYQELAGEIEDMVLRQVLRPGERLASVRQQRARRGVSPATVFQAYDLLQARGIAVARPRSGYYVADHALAAAEAAASAAALDMHGAARAAAAAEPEPSQPDGESVAVDVSELVFQLLDAGRAREVIPFGSAFPSPLLFPLAKLARAAASGLRNIDPWSTVADLPPGNAELRRQIALRYQQDGVQVDADDIVITNGALEALNLCLQAVARPGDTVLIESPSFYAGLQALERLQLKAIEVATHPRDGIDLEALADALQRHRPKACWLMTSFQNPLGSLMPPEKKQALVELLAAHQVPLIEDDVYGELYFDARRPALAKRYDSEGLVMHCGSFSKCLAPGFRIGWAAAGRHARAVGRLKTSTSLAAAMPSQLALADYLGQGGYERHLRHLRQTLERQRDLMLDALAEHFPPGTRVTRPRGGYFLWVVLPSGVDALALHRAALAQGIGIAPGPMFSARREFNNCIRLNYGHLWDASHARAMAVLGALAHAALPAGAAP